MEEYCPPQDVKESQPQVPRLKENPKEEVSDHQGSVGLVAGKAKVLYDLFRGGI